MEPNKHLDEEAWKKIFNSLKNICKMNNKAIHLSTFVDKVLSKYRIEKFH